MKHILDRPVWSALETRHSALAQGDGLARRYPASISMFAASADSGPQSMAALAALPDADKGLVLVEPVDTAAPPGFETVMKAPLVQMIGSREFPAVDNERIVPLDAADAAEMLALADLTKPGPFSLKAQSFGSFWGVKANGRLVAMAGQRLKQPGFVELSGVCTHPDFQGQGLGRLMSLYVSRQIQQAGDLPYLHSFATNDTAIGLYESIGYKKRTALNVMIIQPPR